MPASEGEQTGGSKRGGERGGTAGGSDGGPGRSTDATSCILVKRVPAKGGMPETQSLTNTCNVEIGINWCHGPSSAGGTKTTECGYKDRYFQQFSSLKPGETYGNPYSMPGDARITFGACIGGQSKIKQTTNGGYVCRS
jgi:hypothetical protein